MWIKRERSAKELIDAPAEQIPLDEYRLAARALEWSNKNWGGYAALFRPLKSLIAYRRMTGFTLLDAGCGSGDIDEGLVQWARKSRMAASIIAIDSHPHAAQLARERLSEYPEISVVHTDFFETKFSDASFDFVIASLLLHHLTDEQRTFFLLKAYRLCRVGVILTDLRRSLPAHLFARTILPAIAPSPKSRLFAHDAPLSFRRAFTLKEMREFLARGGHPYMATVPWWCPFRMVLKAERLTEK